MAIRSTTVNGTGHSKNQTRLYIDYYHVMNQNAKGQVIQFCDELIPLQRIFQLDF